MKTILKIKKLLTKRSDYGIIVKRLTKGAKNENETEAAQTQSGSGVFDQDLEN
jgi:hypothetical protein